MKFLDIFVSDVRFIMKQGSTSWLILLYPILLILVVGIGLNIGTSDKLTVAVYGNDTVFDSLAADNSLNVVHVARQSDLEALVRSKGAVMGVDVEENVSRKVINIYLDPTKQAVASSLLLMVDKAVNEEKLKSGASLGALQNKLAPSLVDLKAKRREMSAFASDIYDLKRNVTATKEELEQARGKLSTYRVALLEYKSDLGRIDDYRAKLAGYDSNLSGLSNSLYDKENERAYLSNRISYDITKIDNYLYETDTMLTYVSYAKSYSTSYYNSYYLNQTEYQLLSMKSDLTQSRADLVSINNELWMIDFNSMQTEISGVRSDMGATSGDLASFKLQSGAKIDSVLADVNDSDAEIASAIGQLTVFESRLDSLQNEIIDTGYLLDKVITPLEEFLGKKPEELLPPEINSVSVFPGENRMDMFFPSVIGVDMILASILLPMIMRVRMKEQGVELRMLRSRAGTLSVIAGEMLANYLVSLLQLTLICAFGVLFFGVSVGNLGGFAIVFATVPLVFTSLGVLLSYLVNRSSTAFLLSLLISIPMIFICGTIIPLEFLNPAIAAAGRLMPLYVVIDFTEKMFFRNVALAEVVPDYLYLLFFTGFNTVASMAAYYLKR